MLILRLLYTTQSYRAQAEEKNSQNRLEIIWLLVFFMIYHLPASYHHDYAMVLILVQTGSYTDPFPNKIIIIVKS